MNKERAKKNAEYERILKYKAGKEATAAFRHKAFCVKDIQPAKECQNREMVFTCTGCNKCGRYNDHAETESVAEYLKRKGININARREDTTTDEIRK